MPGLRDSPGKNIIGGGTSMNTDTAVELQEQAWNLQAEGKLEEAAVACEKALALLEELGEQNSPDAANLLNDLAEIEFERQSFQRALALAEQAHTIEDALGDQFAGESAARVRNRTLQLIGETCRMAGDFERAETSLLKALAIVSVEFGAICLAEPIARFLNLSLQL